MVSDCIALFLISALISFDFWHSYLVHYQGQHPSYFTYGQSPSVHYYEGSSPPSGSPPTRIDQRRSPASTVSTPPHTSPVSQADLFARNSPPTPPMVILNTVNNFFSATTPPSPRPQTSEAWSERRQSPTHHNLPLDQDYRDDTTSGIHRSMSPHPLYDYRSLHDSYQLHQECGQHYHIGVGLDSEFSRSPQPLFPVSYIPSSTTLPSFGSVLQMNNDSDALRAGAGRLRDDRGANEFGPNGRSLQVPGEVLVSSLISKWCTCVYRSAGCYCAFARRKFPFKSWSSAYRW